jgi:two-component system cell cycle sensor histidine kinase/response regulator CckA
MDVNSRKQQPQDARTPAEIDLLQERLRAAEAEIERLRQGEEQALAAYNRSSERFQSTQRLQSAALNAAANSILITDRFGAIEWVNAAFCRATGYTEEAAVGQVPWELLRSPLMPDEDISAIRQDLRAGRTWNGEVLHRRQDGTDYPAELTITPVKDPDGENAHFIAIERDLTEQKKLEAQVLQAQKMETVGRLAGGIAHDFNNLLTVIIGAAEFGLDTTPELHPLRAELRQIEEAGERAAALTRQLLAFSRKQILAPKVFNLSALVAGVRGMLRRLIGEAIDLKVLPEARYNVRADAMQIEQVIWNLVVNARDAMPAGGTLTIATRDVEVGEETGHRDPPDLRPGTYVLLEVSDDGTGMDDRTSSRIFEPFFTTKDTGNGTGLGLSTVYGIVRQSGGIIGVDSEVGQGTTFRIYLPRVLEPEAEAAAAAPAAIQGRETILVVEDEAMLLALIRRILRSAGYTVLAAAGGPEALELAARHPGNLHLMVSDVVMPQMTGPELAGRLALDLPHVKVLYTSGYTNDEVLRHGVLDGVANFLPKPFSRANLLKKVREVLDKPAS